MSMTVEALITLRNQTLDEYVDGRTSEGTPAWTYRRRGFADGRNPHAAVRMVEVDTGAGGSG